VVRDMGFLIAGIIVGLAALIMGLSLKQDYRSSDQTFLPESPARIARPATSKHFFRPGSGIGVEPIMANSNN
jgi:hypothetical protein